MLSCLHGENEVWIGAWSIGYICHTVEVIEHWQQYRAMEGNTELVQRLDSDTKLHGALQDSKRRCYNIREDVTREDKG